MDTGKVTKTGRIVSTPTPNDRYVRVDFGDNLAWIPETTFLGNMIKPRKGDRIKVEFQTEIRTIRRIGSGGNRL